MLRMGLSGAEMSTRCATSRLPVEAVRPPLLRDGWLVVRLPPDRKECPSPKTRAWARRSYDSASFAKSGWRHAPRRQREWRLCSRCQAPGASVLEPLQTACRRTKPCHDNSPRGKRPSAPGRASQWRILPSCTVEGRPAQHVWGTGGDVRGRAEAPG